MEEREDRWEALEDVVEFQCHKGRRAAIGEEGGNGRWEGLESVIGSK